MSEAPRARQILHAALAIGLVAGLGEGLLLWGFQAMNLETWEVSLQPVAGPIVLSAMVVDLGLSLAVGLALLGVRRWLTFGGVLTALLIPLFYAWLGATLTGRLAQPTLWILAVGLAVTTSRALGRRLGSGFSLRPLGLAVILAAGMVSALYGRVYEAFGNWLNPAPAQGSPNFLVVVVDALRADRLGAYGYSRPTSPVMDSLARSGVVFTHSFATGTWSLPSHASLVTGLATHEHKASWCHPIDRVPTIGAALQQRGYRTGGFSGNLIFFAPSTELDRGFQRFSAVFFSTADAISRTIFGRRFDALVEYVDRRAKLREYLLEPLGIRPLAGPKRADRVTQEVLSWVSESRGRPFFAMLNYFDAHGPELPPEPWANMFSTPTQPFGPLTSLSYRYDEGMTPEQLKYLTETYDGSVRYIDAQLGELLAGLEARGLAANTVVVVTSDHGELFGRHHYIGHRGDPWYNLLRTPLIVSWRGHLRVGRRVEAPVSNSAIAATLLDLAGGGEAFGSEPSLVPQLRDSMPPALTRAVIGTTTRLPPRQHSSPNEGWTQAIVTPEWYFVRRQREPHYRLFRLSDTAQVNDLSDSDEGRAVIPHLLDSLRARLPDDPDPCWVDNSTPVG